MQPSDPAASLARRSETAPSCALSTMAFPADKRIFFFSPEESEGDQSFRPS